jgi:hypothetical protein
VTPLDPAARRCFYRPVRIFWDERRIDRLEKKMDDGFAELRSEARADFRLLLGVLLAMFMTTILGFAGILLQLN